MHRSRRGFNLYLLILLMVITAVCGLSVLGHKNELTALQWKKATAAVSEISSQMDGVLASLVEMTSTLNRLPWVLKMYPGNEFLDRTYFTTIRKYEISQEFAAYYNSDLYTESFALLFPYSDTAISKNLWADCPRYLRILGLPESAIDDTMEQIKGITKLTEMHPLKAYVSQIIFCAPMEKTQKPRAYLFCALDTARIQTLLQSTMRTAEGMADFAVMRGTETVLRIQQEKAAAKTLQFSSPSKYVENWSYRFLFNDDVSRLGYLEYVYRAILLGLCAFLGLAIGGWIVMQRVVLPISKLKSSVVQEKRKKLDHVVDALVSERDRQIRNDALRQLLRGSFQAESALAQSQGMIREQDFSQVFILVPGEGAPSSAGPIMDAFGHVPGVRMEAVETINEEMVLICIAENPDLLEEQEDILVATLHGMGWGCCVGEVFSGVRGVSNSYHHARIKARYIHRGDEIRYYFPFPWENQLIQNIRQGNQDAVSGLLDQIKRENDRRIANGEMQGEDYLKLFLAIHMCLQRLTIEIGADTASTEEILLELLLSADKQATFQAIGRVCAEFCETFTQMGAREKNTKGDEIHALIERRYTDSGFSLPNAAEELGMSVNTLNKYLKQANGETFYTCLTRIRMEHAKDMLLSGKLSVAGVAKECGYESDIAFRRAFKHYTGVAPRDFQNG